MFDRLFSGEDLQKRNESSGRRNSAEAGLEVIPGEIEKSGEVMRIISFVNEALVRKQRELGVANPRIVDPRRVHVLPGGVYKKYFPGTTMVGRFQRKYNRIVLNEDDLISDNFERNLLIIQHESIHLVSHQNDLGRNGSGYYVGYQTYDSSFGLRFVGLNEAVTEQMNQDMIAEFFSKSIGNQTLSYWGYSLERRILFLLIEGVHQGTGESPRDILRRFERGLFVGDHSHLVSIDRVYGPGSLRILSLFSPKGQCGLNSDLGGNTQGSQELFLKYFETPGQSWKVRNALARRILDDAEYALFLKENGG